MAPGPLGASPLAQEPDIARRGGENTRNDKGPFHTVSRAACGMGLCCLGPKGDPVNERALSWEPGVATPYSEIFVIQSMKEWRNGPRPFMFLQVVDTVLASPPSQGCLGPSRAAQAWRQMFFIPEPWWLLKKVLRM